MAVNKFYTVGGVSRKEIIDQSGDGSEKYAIQSGHLLEFQDARKKSIISFKAFINSFSQSFTSNWNAESVFGRMDDIATFKNTTRSISVSWEVPSEDLAMAKVNLQRCNQLVHLLYPTYQPATANTMTMSPFVRIRYANLLCDSKNQRGLFGYITSLTWTPVLDIGYYHDGGEVYPKVITISVEFTAIHDGRSGETGHYTGRTDLGIQAGSVFPFGGTNKK